MSLSVKQQKRIRRERVLKLFQDVASRWDLICHMLIRAHDLRAEIDEFCVNFDVTYLRLDRNEWSQIEYLIDLLRSFFLFTKVLSVTRTSIIHIVFKIYNRLFEHLKKIKLRLLRKRVSWKKSLITALAITKAKLTKYYSQTQNELGFLYEKTVLLHFSMSDEMFQSSEWKMRLNETSWHKVYWDALKNIYRDYTQISHAIRIESRDIVHDSEISSLKDLLNDEESHESFSNDNEFTAYRRQDESNNDNCTNLCTNQLALVSFTHLKKKSILDQWKKLKSRFLTITRIARDVLAATSFDVANERLFSIASRIYEAHKSYHPVTIRAKMIVQQHDYKKNEWELEKTHLNLKEEEVSTETNIQKKLSMRDQTLQDESERYISDNDETVTVDRSMRYFRFSRDTKANMFFFRIVERENVCIRLESRQQ